jgi:hypothetical protein
MDIGISLRGEARVVADLGAKVCVQAARKENGPTLACRAVVPFD